MNIAPVSEKENPWDGAGVSRGWFSFFTDVRNYVNWNSQYGTTANRPTKYLYPGRMYFDESLGVSGVGMMIYVNKNSTGWVDGAGNTV